MVLSLVVGNIGAGQITGRIGYYTSQAYASAIVLPIGAGLLTTLQVDTGHAKWIGYQILFGFGTGLGMQQGTMAAQTVLSRKDAPIGVSMMMLCQQLGGAIFVSVGQNVFDSSLVSGLTGLIPGITPEAIVNTGATNLRGVVPAQDLPALLNVYNGALRWVWVVGTIMCCLSAIGAAGLEWRSVKAKEGSGGKGKAVKVPDKSSKALPVEEKV
jgi:hypothetical protein